MMRERVTGNEKSGRRECPAFQELSRVWVGAARQEKASGWMGTKVLERRRVIDGGDLPW